MKKQIKFYRILLNIIFYVFYVLIISILFSFIFPLIMVLLGKEVLDPSSPVFTNIQILIVIIVFIFSLTLRKYFYLPITSEEVKVENKINFKEIEKDINKTETKIKSDSEFKIIPELRSEHEFKSESENNSYENFIEENLPELDIKIGKEIK